MIAIVDYGVGNLRSVFKALDYLGVEAVVTDDGQTILSAQGVILPGVGAFGDAADTLRATGLDDVVLKVAERHTPLLGICVGMQLLFEESLEMGVHRGLGILPGRIVRFPVGYHLTVPHTGWNQIHVRQESSLLRGVREGDFAYFVHSYYPVTETDAIVLATTDYGIEFASVVGRERICGIQFHPEKSQDVGLRILRNFADMVEQA